MTAFRKDLAVHGRYGEPCPRCGDKILRIRYADNETNYCARCQTGGKVLADRSLSRLLGADWPRTLDELEVLKRRYAQAPLEDERPSIKLSNAKKERCRVAGRTKGEYNLAMPEPRQKLNPTEVLERLQIRLRRRIEALEGMRLPGYSTAIDELQVEMDLLKSAQRYLEE